MTGPRGETAQRLGRVRTNTSAFPLRAKRMHNGAEGNSGMASWQDECLQQAMAAPNEAALITLLESVAAQLGFEYCAYFARVAIPVTQPRYVFCSNLSQQWSERYLNEGWWAHDPAVMRGERCTLPLVWDEQTLAGALPAFRDAALGHGLRFGWSQSCLDAQGARGTLTFARAQPALTDLELRHKNAQMAWMAQVIHAAMMSLTAQKYPVLQPPVALSEREREVLRWTAEGKTSAEVADILRISERTVNYHINRCIEKLKVNNKLAATVRAAMQGML
jgi:LuxR family transcriptional regulator